MDTVAILLLNQGETKRALGMLQDAIELNPSLPELRYNYARALVENGDKAKAILVLGKLLKSPKPFLQRQDAEKLLQQLR